MLVVRDDSFDGTEVLCFRDSDLEATVQVTLMSRGSEQENSSSVEMKTLSEIFGSGLRVFNSLWNTLLDAIQTPEKRYTHMFGRLLFSPNGKDRCATSHPARIAQRFTWFISLLLKLL